MPNYDESIIFNYHPPRPQDVDAYQVIRAKQLEFALLLRELCPPSRELQHARKALEEVGYHANAAIARQPAYLRKIEAERGVCHHCSATHPGEKCPRLVAEEKEQTEREAALAEAERVAKMRALYPNAKPQTVTYP